MFHRIVVAQPRAEHKVWIEYEDGAAGEADFTPLIKRGGVFAKLADPAFFNQARIGEGGRFLEWPDAADFCADALHPLALHRQ